VYRLILAALICSIVPLQAGVLWYQAPDTVATAYVDQEFPDLLLYGTYQVHDVTVDPGGWTIQSITSYFTTGHGWPATGTARLNIFSKTGTLPMAGDDPTVGTSYAASLSVVGGSTLVTAGGLSINLAAGAYWIGLTPIFAFSSPGQEWHQVVAEAVVGDYSAVRNPGGGFGFGPNWGTYAMMGLLETDGAILIEGTAGSGAIPEPATWSLLALGVGALAFLRRRK
jgi:hypothetical protein